MPSQLAATGVGGSAETVLILDQFSGTSGTNLHSHTISPTNTPNTSWTNASGNDFQLNGSGAITPESSSVIDVCDPGQPNYTVSVIVNWNQAPGSNQAWLLGRYENTTNYWTAQSVSGALILKENVAGTLTSRGTYSITWSLSTNYTIAMQFSGNNITVSLNTTAVITYSSSDFNTQTKAGMRYAYVNLNAATFADFEVTSP